MQDLFFELIRVALGTAEGLTRTPSHEEWGGVYELARGQGLVGVCYAGVCRLPEAMRPADDLMMMWTGMAVKIRERNEQMNRWTRRVAANFRQEGFRSSVMKGQAVAALYGELALYRQSGDVDVLLDADRDRIVRYVTALTPRTHIMSHHIDFPVRREVAIEVHFKPAELCNPLTQRRLMAWYRAHRSGVFEHEVVLPDGERLPAPDAAFNVVFVVLHVYKHLFAEGIGLRQLMDVFFVLEDALERLSAEEWAEIARTVRRLQLRRFAGAVLWLMQWAFGMAGDRVARLSGLLKVAPDEGEGRWLLNDVLQNGNMGHGRTDDWITHDDAPWRRFRKLVAANVRLVTHYPSEALWYPYFKLWHYPWRRYMEWKWKLK